MANQTPEASDHRCSGCDHRWRGGPAAPNEWTGAELCGDCWRRVQTLLHRPEASEQQRAYDLSEAILRCWNAGQPYVSEAARADMIAIIHAHDAAVRAEQAALYENAQCVTCAGHLDAEQSASDTARIKELEAEIVRLKSDRPKFPATLFLHAPGVVLGDEDQLRSCIDMAEQLIEQLRGRLKGAADAQS